MFHGWSDPAITALNSIDYWTRVVRAMRGRRRTDAFLRLFLAPGMQHCAGGPGPNVFDPVGALEQWVEHGVAPERIVATHRTAGVVDRTRPLCPHPRVARWDGAGDVDDAASFECARGRDGRPNAATTSAN
jgi:feruloyl esterase